MSTWGPRDWIFASRTATLGMQTGTMGLEPARVRDTPPVSNTGRTARCTNAPRKAYGTGSPLPRKPGQHAATVDAWTAGAPYEATAQALVWRRHDRNTPFLCGLWGGRVRPRRDLHPDLSACEAERLGLLGYGATRSRSPPPATTGAGVSVLTFGAQSDVLVANLGFFALSGTPLIPLPPAALTSRGHLFYPNISTSFSSAHLLPWFVSE